MISTSGNDWIEVRDAVCSSSKAEQDAVLLLLEVRKNDAFAQIAASCIRLRIRDPERASTFDAMIRQDLGQKMHSVSGKRLLYGFNAAALLQSDDALAPLAAELMALRADLPQSLRLAGMRSISRSDLRDEVLLGMIEREPWWSGYTTMAMSLSKLYADSGDRRVLEGLERCFHWARTNHPDAPEYVESIAGSIETCGTAEAHRTLVRMISAEKTRLEAANKAPWNDDALGMIMREQTIAERHVKRLERLGPV